MYSHRYETPRGAEHRIPKPSQLFLHHVILRLKTGRPWDVLIISALSFAYRHTHLTSYIPVIHNLLELSPQAPVKEQLAVVLSCFDDGNATSLQKVANWAGIAKVTVLEYTRCILIAILRPEFMQTAVKP